MQHNSTGMETGKNLVGRRMNRLATREDISFTYYGLEGAEVSGPKPQLTRVLVNLVTNAQGKMEYWYEPMSTQEASNKRYNTAEYKTQYLVLRKVPAGVYTIGAPFIDSTGPNRGPCTPHSVTMQNDYYVGVFYVTRAQYQRIMSPDDTPSSDTYPRNYCSWSTIRGNALPAAEAGDGEPPAGYVVPLIRRQSIESGELDYGANWLSAAQVKEAAAYLAGIDEEKLRSFYTTISWLKTRCTA